MKEQIIDGKPHVLVPKDVWEMLEAFFNGKDSAGE